MVSKGLQRQMKAGWEVGLVTLSSARAAQGRFPLSEASYSLPSLQRKSRWTTHVMLPAFFSGWMISERQKLAKTLVEGASAPPPMYLSERNGEGPSVSPNGSKAARRDECTHRFCAGRPDIVEIFQESKETG